ncbi:hypothetical protein [Acinetobacter pittii]|uniref:hypothetical protein n=1 Tax=Acinetobacter pittii TaxID=48296 RepID=UPI000A347E11|nr:hypothetical protein [Acinetobacter pittii]OTM21483.1 hypothetical protein B9X52_03445 [Acinetobacter pittii]
MGKTIKESLQTNKYDYTWSRDDGDAPFKGKSDRIKVDKDEGYEVVYFIKKFIEKHSLKTVKDVQNVEDALHANDLSSVEYRDELIAAIEKKLGL